MERNANVTVSTSSNTASDAVASRLRDGLIGPADHIGNEIGGIQFGGDHIQGSRSGKMAQLRVQVRAAQAIRDLPQRRALVLARTPPARRSRTSPRYWSSTAYSKACLCGKYWYIVPTETPARCATRVVVSRAMPSESKT